jgi:drug/metabolite transporter (DMT)-like permease
LIVVGLLSSVIVSPITDRYKQYLATLKICVPVLAVLYIAFIFAPSSSAGIALTIAICALLGAFSLSLLPVVLEFLVEVTYPVSPEIGSTLCWSGGQLLGAVFTIIQTALTAGPEADPPNNMRNALIFSAVVAVVAVPFPLCLGLFGRKVVRRRLEAETAVNNIDLVTMQESVA